MIRVDTRRSLTADARAAVLDLVLAARQHTGERPLPDHLWVDLVHGSGYGLSVALAWRNTTLVGYAQVSESNESRTLSIVLKVDLTPAEIAAATTSLLQAAIGLTADDGGGELHWWITDVRSDVQQASAAAAATAGFRLGRTLLQMRVDLPLADHHAVAAPVRPFVPGDDDLALLEVNNAAFGDHNEQGGWTPSVLRRREREPWFDPDGLLMHHRGGRLAAFCWTKIHDDTLPVMGEIYVIAVHPDFHGLGLGRALTVAGLAHIAQRGIGTGMLFVDEANTVAVSLYRSLGFRIHRTDRAYVGVVVPAAADASAAQSDGTP